MAAVLETVANIRKRLGYDDVEIINNAIEQALSSATVATEDSVRSDLARATVVDQFFVIWSREFNVRQGQTFSNRDRPFRIVGLTPSGGAEAELKLSRGFVDPDITLSVFAANSYRNVVNVGTGSRADLVSPDDFTLLEAERGVLRIQDFLLNNCYVQVSYTAGFSTDGGCPEKYIATGGSALPDWLVECAALKTTLLLNGNPVVRRDPLDATQIATVQGQLDKIIISNSRYAPGAVKPNQSTVTLV